MRLGSRRLLTLPSSRLQYRSVPPPSSSSSSQYPPWTPPPFLCPSLAGALPSLPTCPWHCQRRSYSAGGQRMRSGKTRSLALLPIRSHGERCEAGTRAGAAAPHGPRLHARRLHIESARSPARRDLTATPAASGLPLTCPGCGAYSQTDDRDKAGHYSAARKPVRTYLAAVGAGQAGRGADEDGERAFRTFLETWDAEKGEQRAGSVESTAEEEVTEGLREQERTVDEKRTKNDRGDEQMPSVPLCDRCNHLVHHNAGVPIFHPDVSALQSVLAESPHSRNHIYHVVDAVDFPMSLIRGVHALLDVATQSRNRRSRLEGGRPTLSFVITRADLLVPTKEQADRLMAPMREILADTLGRRFKDVRIGQIRCVSAMRGWWTGRVKDEINAFKGGCWMIGKVNVGKSKLIETVFPKGTGPGATALKAQQPDADRIGLFAHQSSLAQSSSAGRSFETGGGEEGPDPLILPPAAPETSFPVMPTISHLPGTTAQPIRLRYGNGRGEVIDLPGLDRQDMTSFVREDKQALLVMRTRVKAAQQVIRPGQSLMIGDLVRITPRWPAWEAEIAARQADHWDTEQKVEADEADRANEANEVDGEIPSASDTSRRGPDLVVLAAAFVPFQTHVTATEKGAACQAQTRSPSGMYEQLLAPGMGSRVASAGTYDLSWDATRDRAGPLTKKAAAGLSPSSLPFVVCSIDLVIEGVGWIELTCQLRRRVLERAGVDEVDDLPPELMPSVEVFSPDGKHVLARRPLGLFMMAGKRRKPREMRSQRPRRSMKGVKKELKKARRAKEAPATWA